jgi:C4-dicarboxylate-specific signal transduction histidine kinase
VEGEQTVDEVKRLQDCINDLIGIETLAAIWGVHEPSQSMGTLLEVLVRILRLDFICARFVEAPDGVPTDVVRLARRPGADGRLPDIERAFDGWLTGGLPATPLVVANPIGDGTLSIATGSLGLQGDPGVLLAASARTGFPTDIEMLLLRAAANQATIGLQEASALLSQRRAAKDLERRVAERTRELTTLNAALQSEIAARKRIEAERRRAEEALRKAQEALAHVTRVMSMGELTASIAHEVNQPLAAIVANAGACLRWLDHAVPNLIEARLAVESIVRDGRRASDVIQGIRAISKRAGVPRSWLDVDGLIRDVLTLAGSEVREHGVSLRVELSSRLPAVQGDRVQLQQVILNLLKNGIEAMDPITDRPRELLIRSDVRAGAEVLVAIRDSGVGLVPQNADQLFDAFFTTKPNGMGLGLSISRRVIEAHGGRLWATPNDDHGVTLSFILPAGGAGA